MPHNNADWMSSLDSTPLIDFPLADLAIPGSHNSGTFALECNGHVVPGTSPEIEQLANNPLIGQMAKGVIYRWAVCQSLDFTNQLLSGIRYFDLRVATKPDSQDIFCVHQLYGPKITDFTDAVNKYLSDHPREIVLIDFNHFYNFELEHHIQLVTFLISAFGSKICHRSDFNSLTLRKLWEENKQVIMFYQYPEVEMFPEVFLANSISSPWPNTPDKNICLKFLNETFSKKHEGFLVCQGVLTPTASTIMTGLLDTLENWTKLWTAEFTSWLATSDSCIQPLNIVIADFVHAGNFIQNILDLNKKRIK
ncbi:PI-PLC X domain-containing protein 2 [Bulinus truncatus]|nr:PI-PLC X domain-containing protein 2 [Bulinus truncatus]